MTPSPEAGELTPERLAERLRSAPTDSRSAALMNEAADALQAMQVRLEEALSMREGEAYRNDIVHNGLEARAELAEQEASRCKAEAEKTFRAIELRVDGLNTRGFKQKAETQTVLDAIKQHCRRALTSLRGDAP